MGAGPLRVWPGGLAVSRCIGCAAHSTAAFRVSSRTFRTRSYARASGPAAVRCSAPAQRAVTNGNGNRKWLGFLSLRSDMDAKPAVIPSPEVSQIAVPLGMGGRIIIASDGAPFCRRHHVPITLSHTATNRTPRRTPMPSDQPSGLPCLRFSPSSRLARPVGRGQAQERSAPLQDSREQHSERAPPEGGAEGAGTGPARLYELSCLACETRASEWRHHLLAGADTTSNVASGEGQQGRHHRGRR